MMTSLTFYGGVEEIGGNKILLEEGGTRLFFDFGTSFGRRYRFFEEYLKPRAIAGLLDLLEMGLLPPLHGVYRDDLVSSEELWPRFRSAPHYRELEAHGVLLSHAHVDHSGYISFLRPDIPVYSTAMTAFIAKAMQDSGTTDFEKEVCYCVPREVRDGVLQACNWQKVAAIERPFHIFDFDALSAEALAFWSETPGGRALEARSLTGAIETAPLPARYFPVDHSIFGAAALAVETSAGWLIYSGDLRRHGGRRQLTEDFIEAAARLRPAVLLCEGTNTEVSEAVSEEEVYSKALAAVAEATALVIADFGPRNIDRLLIFRRIAAETGRCLTILAKDAYLLEAMRLVSPEVPDLAQDKTICIYEDVKATLNRWEKGLRTRHKAKLVTPQQVRREQDSYILCFSFFDINDLPDILPRKGSIYLYSSSEAHNEEQEMDLWRLHNWLDHFGMKGIGLPLQVASHQWEVPPEQQGLHASGHASAGELIELVKQIGPKTLIPIHTEEPNFFVRNLEGSGIEVRKPIEGGTFSFP